MTPQDQGRYSGTPTAELERLLRDPALPAADRQLIEDQLADRLAKDLLGATPGAPPRPAAVPPPPPFPPPHTARPGQPAGWPQPPVQPSRARPPHRRRGFLFWGLVSFAAIGALTVIIIVAAVIATVGSDSSSSSTTFATECVIPGFPQDDCHALPDTPIGTSCGCRDSLGLVFNGTAQ